MDIAIPSVATSALLVVDMFNHFDFPGGERLLRNTVGVIPRINVLTDFFELARRPIYFVNDDIGGGSATTAALRDAVLERNAMGAQITHQLMVPPSAEVVLKPRHSGFTQTELGARLARQRVERVTVCGIAADLCVLATAIDAAAADFKVHVPMDCVAAEERLKCEAALLLLSKSFKLEIGSAFPERGH